MGFGQIIARGVELSAFSRGRARTAEFLNVEMGVREELIIAVPRMIGTPEDKFPRMFSGALIPRSQPAGLFGVGHAACFGPNPADLYG